MNPMASRELRIRSPPRTILVSSSLSKAEREKTVRHERVEYGLMKRGMKYREAHSKSPYK